MTTTKQSWLKRSLAVLLAVMMVMSMGVANVFAAGTESSEKSVKEQLQELVDYADTLDPADYTPESWSPVNILLTGIKANINNEEMLSQYGEQWLSTLKQKLDDLVLVEKSVKEQLQELLDYADTLDPTDYTPESWSPVNILLTGIKANINNEEKDSLLNTTKTWRPFTTCGFPASSSPSSAARQPPYPACCCRL